MAPSCPNCGKPFIIPPLKGSPQPEKKKTNPLVWCCLIVIIIGGIICGIVRYQVAFFVSWIVFMVIGFIKKKSIIISVLGGLIGACIILIILAIIFRK
jgi:Na+/phosphate symporter